MAKIHKNQKRLLQSNAIDATRLNSFSQNKFERVLKVNWSFLYANLLKKYADFTFVEDLIQDTILKASESWQKQGFPIKPRAWLMRVAHNQAIDQLRRRNKYQQKLKILRENSQTLSNPRPVQSTNKFNFDDHRLQLIFTCCHPALSEEAQIALTLRTIGGLNTLEIAKAFLIKESSMAQRIVRAQRKIKQAKIPYKIPSKEIWPERLSSVLKVIYLIFNEGYYSHSGETIERIHLCKEAIYLGELLVTLIPSHGESLGLLALMYSHQVRFEARNQSEGHYCILQEHDRTLYNTTLLAKSEQILEAALKLKNIGVYQIQAAISLLHSQATSFKQTDWKQIYFLYQELLLLENSPIVLLNQSIALSYYKNAYQALILLLEIEKDINMQSYGHFFSTRANFYSRIHNNEKAKCDYEKAIQLSSNMSEKRFFKQKIDKLKLHTSDTKTTHMNQYL